MPTIKPSEQVEPREVNSYQLDVDTIEKECLFLGHCRENPAEIDEPQWYAMLSVVGRLKKHGEEDEAARIKVHEYSKRHPDYNKDRTDQKLDQALAASGPRTCENINNLWDGCEACTHYKKAKSPVSIKDENFIATEHRGFHYINAKGVYVPAYQDLLKYLKREHHYLCDQTSGQVYLYNGTNYESWTELQVKNFSYNKFVPTPAVKVVNEFYENVKTSGATSRAWFDSTTANKINFNNGILDTLTYAFLPHSPEAGFMYTLPFPYDPSAECPHFDQFLADVTDNDPALSSVLVEYVGYALCCHGEYWLQKALLLVGEGANGKSTFLRIIEELAGRQNISFLSISELHEDTSRCHLEGKLLNISDELPSYNFRNTEMLKKLMGGSASARWLYQNAAMLRNNAKFVFAANDIPPTQDKSQGLFRRLIIAPFNKRFELGVNADPDILKKIIPEAPGIFNRCFAAYKEVLKRGDFTPSETVTRAVEAYREAVDRVGSWIKENIHWNGSWDDAAPYISINEAFERFFSDAKRTEEETCSRHQFTLHMRRTIDHWGERYARRRGDSSRDYVVRGATFIDDFSSEKSDRGRGAPDGGDRF